MNNSTEVLENKRFPRSVGVSRFNNSSGASLSGMRQFSGAIGFKHGTNVDLKASQNACPCCGAELQSQRPQVDLNTNTFVFRDRSVPLTPTQAELLHALLDSHPRTVARDTLIRRVWGLDEPTNANKCLEVHLYQLRRRLPADVRVENVFEVGYRLAIGGAA